MNRTLIAVVDASRARLFTCERIAPAEGLKEQIIERSDLVNPARRLHPSELFSDPHPGSNRTGGLQYGTDDHRDAHLDEIDAEFARAVVRAIAELLRAHPAHRLIVCAGPRMLGELRKTLPDLRQPALAIDELPRNLVKLSPTELRNQLESYKLLPPRPRFEHA